MPGVSSNWRMRMLAHGSHGLRGDLGVPAFLLNSESEAQVFTTNQQPDSGTLVIWENAGASHIGSVAAGGNRYGLPETRCKGSFSPAQRAVWRHLRRWIEEGTVAPSQPRLERAPDGTLARDEHANALGGIRWPHVVVPLGTHRAEPPTDGQPDLMGSTTPFDAEEVRRLYGRPRGIREALRRRRRRAGGHRRRAARGRRLRGGRAGGNGLGLRPAGLRQPRSSPDTGSRGWRTILLADSASISSAPKPSSARTAPVCSPTPGRMSGGPAPASGPQRSNGPDLLEAAPLRRSRRSPPARAAGSPGRPGSVGGTGRGPPARRARPGCPVPPV